VTSPADTFEAHRPRLVGLAYRMLGSVAEAEDVVQEAWLRWSRATDPGCDAPIDDAHAWLTTVVSRLAIDVLRSARVRREQYVGPWLPEPWLGVQPPEDPILASSLSFAFLRLLERLTPEQRAAFVLREVFDRDYGEICEILDVRRDHARQLVRRARTHLQGAPRFTVDAERHAELLQAFGAAAMTGDVQALSSLLVEDAVAWSDGAGEGPAARKPIRGGARLARAYAGFARWLPADATFEPTWANGLPAVITRSGQGVISVHVFEIDERGITGVYAVLAREKLRRVPIAGGPQARVRMGVVRGSRLTQSRPSEIGHDAESPE